MVTRFAAVASLLVFLFGASVQFAEGRTYSLHDLFAAGLDGSEKMLISREEVNVAARNVKKAESVLFPKLTAFGSYQKYSDSKISPTGSVSQPDTSTAWGIRLDQSFSLGKRELTAYRIADSQLEKASTDSATTSQDYLYAVAEGYFRVLKAKRNVAISAANMERLRKHRDSAQLRMKVGEVTKTVVLRAEAEFAGAQAEYTHVQGALSVAKSQLAAVVGISGEYDLAEDGGAVGDIGDMTLDELRGRAQAGRFELRSLEIQKKIAADQIRLTESGYYPTLAVEGVYTRKDDDPAASSLVADSLYAGIRISYPFFEGGLRKEEVLESKIRKRQADLLYAQAVRTVITDVETAYFDYISQREMLAALETRLNFARENFSGVTRQFEYGLATSVDVIDANTLLLTAEKELADALYSCRLAGIRLRRAAGIALSTHEAKQKDKP